MKLIITIIMLSITTFANSFSCNFDATKDQDAQIRSCKLNILRTECEQLKIHIWSTTQVNNYTLEADQINTNAACDSLNITVSDVKLFNNSIQVTYTPISNGQVQAVSIEKWNQVGKVAVSTKAHATGMLRQDSTKVISAGFSIDVDSQDANHKAAIMKQVARKALLLAIDLLAD